MLLPISTWNQPLNALRHLVQNPSPTKPSLRVDRLAESQQIDEIAPPGAAGAAAADEAALQSDSET
jgi:hypothetical protein